MNFSIDDKLKIWQMIFKQYEREEGDGDALYPNISLEDQRLIYSYLKARKEKLSGIIETKKEKKEKYLSKLEDMFFELARDIAQDIEKLVDSNEHRKDK